MDFLDQTTVYPPGRPVDALFECTKGADGLPACMIVLSEDTFELLVEEEDRLMVSTKEPSPSAAGGAGTSSAAEVRFEYRALWA